MQPIHQGEIPAARLAELSIDCAACCGLCCVALYRIRSEGFPADLPPGSPCRHLDGDFRCAIHTGLAARGYKGCMAFDCLGAGQKVAQAVYGGADWRACPEMAGEMFEAFLTVLRLHQMMWYLAEAATLLPARALRPELEELFLSTQRATRLPPAGLIAYGLEQQRQRVNAALHRAAGLVQAATGGSSRGRRTADGVGKDFRRVGLHGRDFSTALLIAADFGGCRPYGANFLGADLRDANFKGADLRDSIFLTQAQVNAARGDRATRLPPALHRPPSWT